MRSSLCRKTGRTCRVCLRLIQWVTNGTFDGADIGAFVVDASGVARPDRT
jgi:hypothetical protein